MQNHKNKPQPNIFPEYINGLDVRPLGLSGRTVRLLRLRPQILATPEQQAFLLDWLPAEKRSEALQQIEEERGLWATPVWDSSQLELWLDVLALAAGHSWTEGWDSFAQHSSFAAGSYAAGSFAAKQGAQAQPCEPACGSYAAKQGIALPASLRPPTLENLGEPPEYDPSDTPFLTQAY